MFYRYKYVGIIITIIHLSLLEVTAGYSRIAQPHIIWPSSLDHHLYSSIVIDTIPTATTVSITITTSTPPTPSQGLPINLARSVAKRAKSTSGTSDPVLIDRVQPIPAEDHGLPTECRQDYDDMCGAIAIAAVRQRGSSNIRLSCIHAHPPTFQLPSPGFICSGDLSNKPKLHPQSAPQTNSPDT